MLATIASATLLGVDGRPSGSRSTCPPGCPASPSSACPTPRAARRATASGPRCCRAGSPGRTGGHRQPGAERGAQGRRRPRPGHRHRAARGRRAAPGRGGGRDAAFIGELGLDGSIRPVPGALPLVDAARRRGGRGGRPASAVEAQLVGRHVVRRRRDPARAAGRPDRRRAVAAAPVRPTTCRRRPSRRTWPTSAGQPAGPLRARGGGGRRPPPAHDRPAGLGQDDAGPAPARACCPTSTDARPSRPPGCTRPPASRCRPAAWCAGHRSGRRTTARRRWPSSVAAARDMQPGEISHRHQRRAVPRRAGRVPRRRARLAAPAARGGRRPRGPGRATAPPSRPGSCWSAP